MGVINALQACFVGLSLKFSCVFTRYCSGSRGKSLLNYSGIRGKPLMDRSGNGGKLFFQAYQEKQTYQCLSNAVHTWPLQMKNFANNHSGSRGKIFPATPENESTFVFRMEFMLPIIPSCLRRNSGYTCQTVCVLPLPYLLRKKNFQNLSSKPKIPQNLSPRWWLWKVIYSKFDEQSLTGSKFLALP